MIGQTLAHYHITAAVGAGGMGEVFRARDTKLNRDVAIKVLPAEVAGDADRLARFQREAQLLASLNHASIAAIHGLEESDGKPFLGLAKAYAGDTDSGSSADLSQSPTLAHTGTSAGLILGTAAYMSPEQAPGKAVDKRADIWSFGVVLFEMLAGRRAVVVPAAFGTNFPIWTSDGGTGPRS